MPDWTLGSSSFCNIIDPLPEADVIQWTDVHLSQFEQDTSQRTVSEAELAQVKRSQSCLVSTLTDQQSTCNEEVEQQDDSMEEEQEEEEEDPPTLYAQELFYRRDITQVSKSSKSNTKEAYLKCIPSAHNSAELTEEVEFHREYEDDQWETEELTEDSIQYGNHERPLMKLNSISLDSQTEFSQASPLNSTNISNIPIMVNQDWLVSAEFSKSISNTVPETGSREEAFNGISSSLPTFSHLVSSVYLFPYICCVSLV